jgi:S1-C subfamily serine protease
MKKHSFLFSVVFALALLATNISTAQQVWSKTASSGVGYKLYNASDLESYKFVGTVTYFGADFSYSEKGGLITKVHQTSPASDFNFKENDVITAIGKFKVTSSEEYDKAMETYKPKDEVVVSYIRDGEERSRIVVLDKIDVYKSEKKDKKLQLPTTIHDKEAPASIKVLETGKF